MSQAKTGATKHNMRSKRMDRRRQRYSRVIFRIVTYLIVVALVGVVIFSIYRRSHPRVENNQETFLSLTKTDDNGILDPSIPDSKDGLK